VVLLYSCAVFSVFVICTVLKGSAETLIGNFVRILPHGVFFNKVFNAKTIYAINIFKLRYKLVSILSRGRLRTLSPPSLSRSELRKISFIF